ncbi:MAG: hypothetical protein R2755_33310 [Acidimicrobiales bacterium]
MTTVFAPFTAIDPVDFQRAVEVTFLGQVWGTRAALARMVPGRAPSSTSARRWPPEHPVAERVLRLEVRLARVRAGAALGAGHEGGRVRLTMVHLPGVNTPQFDWCKNQMSHRAQPVAPIYQPELAARTIVRAAVEGRRNKVLGVWNTMLVAASQLSPAFSEQYGAGRVVAAHRHPHDRRRAVEPAPPGGRRRGSRRSGPFRGSGEGHGPSQLPRLATDCGPSGRRGPRPHRGRHPPPVASLGNGRAPAGAVAHDQPAR